MSVKVFYLSVKEGVPCNSYWDYTIISDTFKYLGYKTAEVNSLEPMDRAIVIVPARHHFDKLLEVNNELLKVSKVVLFLMGDEERVFDVDKIVHPDIEIWLQNPHPGKDDKYHKLGTGYAPHNLSDVEFGKDVDLFFSGQITHKRRLEMKEYLDKYKLDNWVTNYTESFTAGLTSDEYFKMMSRAKIVPAPSGAVIPDSFRTFEALETMAIPIADEINPSGTIDGYWEWLFDDVVPFARIRDWESLKGYTEDLLDQWPENMHRQTAWWIKWKRDFALRIEEQIEDSIKDSDITVMVCTSPLERHPDTSVLDETIASIRYHLPNAEIILQIDGIREEQEHLRENYNEYKSRVLWKCLNEWDKVLPIIFEEHNHQTGMARETLDLVKTPLILYVEQDTPLVIDYEIPFNELAGKISSGLSNVIRLHFEAVIPEEHTSLMLGVEKTDKELMRTVQWSQRPHLASTAYYKRIINECFSAESKSFIEDKMHGVVYNGYLTDGLMGWHQHKLHIYYPEGNLKRSYHTDGRNGAKKYDETQIF